MDIHQKNLAAGWTIRAQNHLCQTENPRSISTLRTRWRATSLMLICVSFLSGQAFADYGYSSGGYSGNNSTPQSLQQWMTTQTQQAEQVFQNVTVSGMGTSNNSFLTDDSDDRPSYSLFKFPSASSMSDNSDSDDSSSGAF